MEGREKPITSEEHEEVAARIYRTEVGYHLIAEYRKVNDNITKTEEKLRELLDYKKNLEKRMGINQDKSI